MIRKYRLGTPFPTESVIKNIEAESGAIPYLKISEGDPVSFSYELAKEDIVYGLGENVRGINKRGWLYRSKNSDEPNHSEEKNSLYAAHNFVIISGKETFGLFIDYAGILTFDVGYTHLDELKITPSDNNLDLYFIEGDSLPDIVKQFRGLIGRSYIPPKWAFGLSQSRWSYYTADEVREVARRYRENHLPIDSICLDIDYMERYKDFTVDPEAFPDLPKLASDLKEMGIKLVPIIDAGVKIEDGYDVYEEGVKNNYFCKREDGSNFVAGVWPGRVHFPDFLQPEARKWFGHKYKVLIDQGVEGFWNDMNEPAIFYSEEHLKEVFEEIDRLKTQEIDIDAFHHFKALVADINNNDDDYKRFYHNVNGEMVRHDKIHNLYGYNMTRAAGESFEELYPDKRVLIYSRSSCIGMHRYAGIWCGDNNSWWSHILVNLKMQASLNMVGILFCGSDIGGFQKDTTEDLSLRWHALGAFTPLMRNHASYGTRMQEAYQFDNIDMFRRVIGVRYALMPYIYSEFMKAALNDGMYAQPLSFVYPEDSFARGVEDQLMIGESIMIAPVYTQNADGRYVYLPERMKLYKFKGIDQITSEILEKGHHYITVDLDEVILFVRPGHMVPYCEGGECLDTQDESQLRLLEFVETEPASYLLYHDDGLSRDYANPKNYTTIILSPDGKKSTSDNSITLL